VHLDVEHVLLVNMRKLVKLMCVTTVLLVNIPLMVLLSVLNVTLEVMVVRVVCLLVILVKLEVTLRLASVSVLYVLQVNIRDKQAVLDVDLV
jgi:hypothetical protein